MDLDTKARGVDVILNISGPIDKLNLTPRSDPPMPLSDIVALLATGIDVYKRQVFDGTITGSLDTPRITGHGNATNVVWSGRTFQALGGDIDLSSTGLAVRNGNVQQGALHAQGAGSLGMRDWQVEDASPVSFAGSIRNAPAADLMLSLIHI